jgi:hypothetical protein
MRTRLNNGKERLQKSKCEVCGNSNVDVLHIHHIIPRRDPRCTNLPANLACLCANCHNLVHADPAGITIVGVYNTSAGRKLLFFFGENPPNDFLPREEWMVQNNPLVSRKI